MTLGNAGVRTLVDSPCVIHSSVEVEDGGHALTVYSSILVEDTDSVMAPVWEEMNGKCFEVSDMTRTQDAAMLFGMAQHRVFYVFDMCPGGDSHNCAGLEMAG